MKKQEKQKGRKAKRRRKFPSSAFEKIITD